MRAEEPELNLITVHGDVGMICSFNWENAVSRNLASVEVIQQHLTSALVCTRSAIAWIKKKNFYLLIFL